jgi:tryptophan synthase beta subunit
VIILGGAIRRPIAVQQFRDMPKLTSSSPAKSAATWVFRNREKPKMSLDSLIIVNLSSRVDNDVAQVAPKVGLRMPKLVLIVR